MAANSESSQTQVHVLDAEVYAMNSSRLALQHSSLFANGSNLEEHLHLTTEDSERAVGIAHGSHGWNRNTGSREEETEKKNFDPQILGHEKQIRIRQGHRHRPV